MTKTLLKALSAAILLGSTGIAHAATITVVETLDLSQFDFSSGAVGLNVNSLVGGPISVSDGDIIDFTLDFSGNQTIQITNPATFYGVLYNPNGIGNHSGTGTVSYLNPSGPSAGTFSMTYNSCCHHLGPVLQTVNGHLATGPGTVEFSGLRTVMQYSGFGSTTLSGFLFHASGSAAGQGSFSGGGGPVPEPAPVALLGGGLLGLAALRRRRAA